MDALDLMHVLLHEQERIGDKANHCRVPENLLTAPIHLDLLSQSLVYISSAAYKVAVVKDWNIVIWRVYKFKSKVNEPGADQKMNINMSDPPKESRLSVLRILRRRFAQHFLLRASKCSLFDL